MSGQLDLFGAFSKMSEVTPRWGYGESCPIWKKMVTERSGDCSARRKQARLTNASDASSLGGWATPVAMNDGIYVDNSPNKSKRHSQGLATQASQNWPTPRAGNPGSRKPGTGGKILAEEAKKSWSTPQSRDHLSAEPKEKWEARAKLQAEKGVNLHLPLNTQCHHIMEEQHNGPPAPEKSSTSGKNLGSPKLNPNWVEQLMGLPVGWTQLPTEWTDSASSETALSPKPQK
jgi:hypothetical protein